MMWCLDHLGISQVMQFEVLPERRILEICVTHMLLIDSFSRKHGIDLCIWEIATDVFWENYMGSHSLQRWCRRWFFKCLRQHHVKNFATAMQLEQRLKESATAFHLECLATERHHSTFALSHKQKTQPTTFFNIWSQIIDLCLMSYSFLCLLHHFFKFNPSPSFLRYSSLYQVCCYRSYTAPKPQDPRLGVGSSWDVSSFGQLEMASWEWNMSKSCWSFKSWRMGMDAYYLTLLLILVGMSRLEWGGAGSFVDMICGNILFEAHGPRL